MAGGTRVAVTLALPSGAEVRLTGAVTEQTGADHPRGAGVIVALDELPAASKESLEAAVRTASEPAPAPAEGELLLGAERELVAALETELETYGRLNPFQILGLGYNADTRAVHAAFAELSKRFHPDRFVRYQSKAISALAEELFVSARAAYRSLANAELRTAAVEAIRARRSAAAAPPAQATLDPLRVFPEALELLDAERFDDAIDFFYKAARDPDNREAARVGVDLASGLRALALGDRLGAGERFAAVLERDPDNELAARELALLRRAHSAERQSHLAKLLASSEDKW